MFSAPHFESLVSPLAPPPPPTHTHTHFQSSSAGPGKSPSDKCRVCQCDLKTKFGLARRLQVIREFKFIPLKGSECRCTVLAETCRTAGIEVEQNPVNYSCRVCNKRARKIRNISKLYRKHQGYFHQHRKIDHCTDP